MTQEGINKFLAGLVTDAVAQIFLRDGLPHSALQQIYTGFGDQLDPLLSQADQTAILAATEASNTPAQLAQALMPYLKQAYDYKPGS